MSIQELIKTPLEELKGVTVKATSADDTTMTGAVWSRNEKHLGIMDKTGAVILIRLDSLKSLEIVE